MTTANRISTKLDKILHDTTTIGMIYATKTMGSRTAALIHALARERLSAKD
jgi:hypothetical protein